MTTWPDDLPMPYRRAPDFPRGAAGDGPDPEVTVVRTRHRRWTRVPDWPHAWQPVSDRGDPMPEFERSWTELVDRYDVWLVEPDLAVSEAGGTSLLPSPPFWVTRADTLTGTWKRGPADVWLKLDRHGQETTYGLTWDQLQRVPGGVRTQPAFPTGRSRVGEVPPGQRARPARYRRWEDVKARRHRGERLFDDVEELEPLDAYGVLRELVVSSDSLAGHGDGPDPERSPVRARVPGVGEPDRYYSVVDVNPVRRDGRLTVELFLVLEPTEEPAT